MADIKLVCAQCGDTFLRRLASVNRARKRGNLSTYCSLKCKGKSQKTGKEVACFKCGKIVWVTPARLRKSSSGMVFCSKSCSISIHNKDGRARKHGMGVYRKNALDYYGPKCRVCGYSIEKVLEVHHRDGDRRNNVMENLVVLCPTHHKELACGIITLAM